MNLFSETAVLPVIGSRLKTFGLAAVFAVASVGAPLFYYQSAGAAPGNTYDLDYSAKLVQPGLNGSANAVQVVADDGQTGNEAGQFGGNVIFNNLDGTNLSALNTLSADYQVTVGDCGGGSPRFYTLLDTNGDSAADKIAVFYFTQNNAVCGNGVLNSGNLAEAADPVQVSNLDGTEQTNTTVGELKTLYPTATITETSVVGDFVNLEPNGQTVQFDNVKVNDFTYTFEPAAPTPVTPANKDACKKDGWKNVRTADNKTFKNQGQCVSYVERTNKEVRGNTRYTAASLNREAWFRMDTASDRGWFVYADANKDWYRVSVKDVSVDGDSAWFYGPVVASKKDKFNGQWILARVDDGNPDKIWGTWVTEAAGKAGVANQTDPEGGSFNVTRGNIRIKD